MGRIDRNGEAGVVTIPCPRAPGLRGQLATAEAQRPQPNRKTISPQITQITQIKSLNNIWVSKSVNASLAIMAASMLVFAIVYPSQPPRANNSHSVAKCFMFRDNIGKPGCCEHFLMLLLSACPSVIIEIQKNKSHTQ